MTKMELEQPDKLKFELRRSLVYHDTLAQILLFPNRRLADFKVRRVMKVACLLV